MTLFKKKLLYLTTVLCLSTYVDEHIYHPNYEIMDKVPYAKYSDGYVYIIKTMDFYNINYNEKDIIIVDETEGRDPDLVVLNSYKLEDKEIRNEIIEIICEYENENPSNWKRSKESMRLEWYIHNLSYKYNYKIDHSCDVDFNNSDEKKYDNILLSKILKL